MPYRAKSWNKRPRAETTVCFLHQYLFDSNCKCLGLSSSTGNCSPCTALGVTKRKENRSESQSGCCNILFLQRLVIKVTSWICYPNPSSLSSSYTSTANLVAFVDRDFSAVLLANPIAVAPMAAQLAGVESPLHVNKYAS